jgi:hypothetical protein
LVPQLLGWILHYFNPNGSIAYDKITSSISTCVEKLEEECACITFTFVECGFFHGDEHIEMSWDNFITFLTFG